MTVALLVLGIPHALPLRRRRRCCWCSGLVLEQIEGYVLTPAVMGHVQQLPPSVVLLSVLAGFHLFGFFGAIIAVPVVAALAMIVDAVLVSARRRALADRRRKPKRAEAQ